MQMPTAGLKLQILKRLNAKPLALGAQSRQSEASAGASYEVVFGPGALQVPCWLCRGFRPRCEDSPTDAASMLVGITDMAKVLCAACAGHKETISEAGAIHLMFLLAGAVQVNALV